MLRISRPRPLAAGLAAALIAIPLILSPPVASASSSQISIMEPGGQLLYDPTGTVHTLRALGVSEIRLNLSWALIAPDPASRKAPSHFAASNPAAYAAANWAPYDAVIRAAHDAGIGIDLDISGRAPFWAQSGVSHFLAQGSNYPSAADYGAFMRAVGTRYSGHYTPPGASTPLPNVTFWSIWNEANYTASLKPQSTGSGRSQVLVSPRIYRGLANAAYSALNATGHRHNKILLGELAPRGYPNVGYGGMYPVVFVQALYCVDSRYRQLQGKAASALGCPTTAAQSRRFRTSNPVLFNATGMSDHPYSRWYSPNQELYTSCQHSGAKLCASLADIGNLVSAVDSVQRAYGSRSKPSIYSTEYGYQTSPPKPRYSTKDKAYNVTTATAAEYINWAEYISYKNPQIASYDQYLLTDPPSTALNNFDPYASGLLLADGTPKASYLAFVVPLYLPKTSASNGGSLEVWGGIRPAPFASLDVGGTNQTVAIQFAPSGSSTFTTLSTVTITNREGYFDTHVAFPSSGTVRLQYTYPLTDTLLSPGTTVYSRTVNVTIH